MNTNTVEVIKLVSDKIDVAMSTLSTKLGVATDHFYPILVKQQYVSAISGISISAVASLVFYLIFRRFSPRADRHGDYGSMDGGITIISAIGMIVSLLFFIACLIEGIPAILNPEYAALMDLLKVVK